VTEWPSLGAGLGTKELKGEVAEDWALPFMGDDLAEPN
jgi:hypothetical protein